MPPCARAGVLGVRHGPREEWWRALLLRQGDQPCLVSRRFPKGERM